MSQPAIRTIVGNEEDCARADAETLVAIAGSDDNRVIASLLKQEVSLTLREPGYSLDATAITSQQASAASIAAPKLPISRPEFK
jgi:hypothetical protein